MTIWPSIRKQQFAAIVCATILPATQSYGWQQPPPAGSNQQQQQNLSSDQLDSLVAPLALYPDPILSQVLVASTYPLEIVEAGRWLQQNSTLKGQDLKNAVSKQPWDASVQALVAFPDLLKQLDQNVNWTTDLGNAFLAQESDVMTAIQNMRKKAEASGKLQSNAQQTVSTTNENNATYIEIEPANPQVIYIPQYEPAAIWGAPAYYPYPPIAYPSTGAVIAAGAISFGLGVAAGAFWSGGGWGWNCGWGHGNVVVNNNFINSNHFNRVNVNNGNVWQHNGTHRGGVPYSNAAVANRFNNVNANRVNNVNANRLNNANGINRPTASQTQQRLNQSSRQMGQGSFVQGRPGQGNMASGIGQANRDMGQRGQGMANRMGGATPNIGGGDRMGNRQIGGGSMGGGSAFSGMHQGFSGAQMNRSRGFSSGGGGGFRGGGGGFRGGGGGSRGGGGRRR